MAITTPRERLKLLRPAPVALLATALLGVALPLQAQPVDAAAAAAAGGAGAVPASRATQITTPDPLQGLAGPGAAPMPAAASAPARGWRVAPAVKAVVNATNNVGLQSSDRAYGIVTTVTPQLQLLGTGPDYRLNGNVAADLVTYLGRIGTDRIFPRGQITLNTRLVDRLFFVDAELGADTTSSTPFDLIGDGTTVYTGSNTVTRQRLSPYIDRELSPTSRLLARSDNTWSQGNGTGTAAAQGADADAHVRTDTVRFDERPLPAGMRAEYNRQATRYRDGGSGLVLATGRLSLLYAPDPVLTLGLTGGTDSANYGTNQVSETLRGVALRWAPSERTVFDSLVEKRFFGTGWNAALTHRSPFMALSVAATRQASTFASRLGTLQAGGDVASMIDAMLQTRILDEATRQAAVQDLIAKRGLSSSLGGPVDLYSRTVQIQQGLNVTLALVGVRHTVTMRIYQTKLEDYRGATEDANSVLGLASDSIQRGMTISLGRRLDPDTTATITLTRARAEGIGANASLGTRSGTILRLGLSHALSPRTTVTGALRHQNGSTSLVGNDASETGLSAGVLHRF